MHDLNTRMSKMVSCFHANMQVQRMTTRNISIIALETGNILQLFTCNRYILIEWFDSELKQIEIVISKQKIKKWKCLQFTYKSNGM